MKKAGLLTLVEFSVWANRRVLAKAARLAPHALHAPAALSYPSVLATLVHLLDAQWYWREAAELGRLPTATLTPADFPTFRLLKRRWKEEDVRLLDFVASRTERQIAGSVTYTWPQAKPRTRPLWHILVHIVNHGTQHRSELALFLTANGVSPGRMDFLDFIRHQTGPRP
jgi:uncharacterized damage-inducible protein DinB